MASWTALLSRPAQTPLAARPSLTLFFLLVGAFLLTLGYHVVNFPVWLTVGIVSAMVLRSVIEVYRLPLPSSTFCGIVALVFGIVIWIWYNTLFGRDAGTAFTGGLITIKFYELRGPRDIALIIFSCFFVVMSVLLYSQVLELFIYCLIMMWVLTALLMRLHTGDMHQDHLINMLGKSGIIYLQALPLGLFLLACFPRYTGTLSFSMDEAKIGLTDTVAPGSIAKLSKDDSTAMNVRFLSNNFAAIDSIDKMYWRGIVLWNYSNGVWTPGSLAGVAGPRLSKSALQGTQLVSQEITVKTHNQRWLFALDIPVTAANNTAEPSSWSFLYNGNVLQMSAGKLNHMARYTVESDLTPQEQTLHQSDLDVSRALPDGKDTRNPGDVIAPRVKALADRLHEGLAPNQVQEYIAAVLKFFRDGKFLYTTTPGEQGPGWLPIFLFQTKAGFCEHFASAFAVLMREERVPTRLVVGYRGAEFNPYSNYYEVLQSNAHAWDEVWIPTDTSEAPATALTGRWIRVDPTAPVSSTGELQNSSSADAQDTLSSQVSRPRTGLYDEMVPAWMKESLREMQLRRDQVESGWDDLVLSYDPETQLRWVQSLGFGNNKAPFVLLLSCFAAAGICAFVFRKWILRKEPVPPVESLYATFCHTMARRGIPRASWEGPMAYTERAAEAFPDDRLAIQRVGSLVAHARYGPTPADAATVESLQSLLTRLTAAQAASASGRR
jgi:transglutaminase-like putative cysteine protease